MVSVITYTEAERSVVGASFISPDATRFAIDHCTPEDFNDPRLGLIFELIIGHRAAKLGTDELTIAKAASERGFKTDPMDLFELREGVPTAKNIAYYAKIVHEGGIRRRLRAAGTRLVQLADGDTALNDVMNAARGEWESVQSSVGVALTAKPLAEVLDGTDEYDWLIPNLLERMDRVIITGGEGAGKALALDTPLPTPTGWTTMGTVKIGDAVLGADGKPTRVTAATGVMHDRECYRVEFSDGSHIIADADHLWLTETYASRIRTAAQARRGATKPRGTDQRAKRLHVPAVVTTRDIAETLHARGGHTLNHTITATAPIDLPPGELPVPPYVLGAWLGDGTSADGAMTIGDEDADEMTGQFASEGWPTNPRSAKYSYGVSGLRVALRGLGVLGDKHIPTSYLRGSYAQRLALLQGLMDTDGTVSNRGPSNGRGSGAARCEFSVMSEQLARDAYELVTSLGIIATLRPSDATINGRVVGTRWRLCFQTDLPVFRLTRKAARITPLRTARSRHRFITAVVPVESVPVRCIQVDNVDRLYLAGRQMVPTHNTMMIRQLAIMASAGLHPTLGHPIDPVRVLVIDAENTERQWRRATRNLAIQAKRFGSVDPTQALHLACTPRIDITTDRDLGSIHRLVDEYEPDMLMIGPLYRLVPRAITNDDDAAPVVTALDTLRDRNLALVIEAHAGHATAADGHRNLRPRGSAALLGWPEFGLGIAHAGDEGDPGLFRLVRWRGDRDQRAWPENLRRGGVWPWQDDTPEATEAAISKIARQWGSS